MKQSRLNHLMLLHVHKDINGDLDLTMTLFLKMNIDLTFLANFVEITCKYLVFINVI